MTQIELINQLKITYESIVAMDSIRKRQKYNLILDKLKMSTGVKGIENKHPNRIIYLTGRFYGLKNDYYVSKSRKREYVTARQQAMTIIYEKNILRSLVSVGALFGKDHATVLHAMNTVNNLCEVDSKYAQDYLNLQRFIHNVK